jgi:hypothetical protein
MGLFNFIKKTNDNYSDSVELIGIYDIESENDVKLIELIINENINKFDAGLITQEIKGTNKLNWQTAYDEKYLDFEGEKLIGDDFEKPKDIERFRVVFFFYFLDFTKPLISQFGLIKITDSQILPDRLKRIIDFKQVD